MARMPDGWVFIPRIDGPNLEDGNAVVHVSVDEKELVMCKNCEHYRPYRHDMGDDSRCALWNAETGEDEYCSRGKRRDGE